MGGEHCWRSPWLLPTPPCTSGLCSWVGWLRHSWSPSPDLDHSCQRAARYALRVTLGLLSLVPSERAGTALWTAMAGHRSSDISDNTFLSPLLLYLTFARAEDVVTKEIKNLSCDSRPLCPSIGHLYCLSVP